MSAGNNPFDWKNYRTEIVWPQRRTDPSQLASQTNEARRAAGEDMTIPVGSKQPVSTRYRQGKKI